MPTYIVIDKNSSFPAAPDATKAVFGINASGEPVTVNENGNVTPVKDTIAIPKPIPYSTKNHDEGHAFNQPISDIGNGSGLPGAVTGPSWNTDILKLTYQTNDLTFLNYNPKYFLFVYYKGNKLSNADSNHPDVRVNNQKYGRYFVHPASYTGSYTDDGMGGWTPSFTSTATYSNFSGEGNVSNYFGSGLNPTYTSSFTSFTTEWDVAADTGKPTLLTGFDPLRFYFYSDINVSPAEYYRGKEFFPFRAEFATSSVSGGGYSISTTTKRRFKYWSIPPEGRTANGITVYNKPRVNLYCKFAIVIQNPSNPLNYIIGPMSDTIKIFPKAGYFEDDVDTGLTYKYYYNWTWQVV